MDDQAAYLSWLAAQGRSPRTVDMAREGLDRFTSFIRDRSVLTDAEVTQETVREYSAYVRGRLGESTGRPLSRERIEHLLMNVRSYFAWQERRGRVILSPAGWLHFPKKAQDRLPRNVPTEEEMNRLMACPNPYRPKGIRDRAMMELLYSTGIRRGELVRLDVADVDLKEKVLTVRRGKNGCARRVPFGEAARERLEKYLRDVRAGYAKPGESALFVSLEWGRRFTLVGMGCLIRKYGLAAGITRPLGLHAFRHAFATHMLAGGAGIEPLRRMLGHLCLSSTQVYTRVKPMDLKAAHKRSHPKG